MELIGIRRYYIDNLKINAEAIIELISESNEKYYTKLYCSENEIQGMRKDDLFRFFNKDPKDTVVHETLKEMVIYWALSIINKSSVSDVVTDIYKSINREEFKIENINLSNTTWGDIITININNATYSIKDILIEEASTSSESTYCITGDTHGDLDFKVFHNAIKAGYSNIFICGDFGYIWDGGHKEQKRLDYLSNLGINIYFVCGNHENFDLLYKYPIVEINGGKAHKIRDNIYHLIRGEIFTFGNKKILAFGGANSIDKHIRKEGKSWWPQEIPTEIEMNNARNNLAKYNNKVDYIITHTGHNRVLSDLFGNYQEDKTSDFLSEIYHTVEYTHWFFGHMHINYTYEQGNTTCIYKLILNLDI